LENLLECDAMSGKRIVLGVTGGIAAYKAVELVRRLRETGAEVRVVMTTGARAFVTPLTFQAVSGQPVHTELLDESAEAGMGHIELARWADQVVVAPATAHFMAQLAHGLAPDLLSTLCLASAAPVLLAPAMNQQMWDNPATRANCQVLSDRGITLAGPASGSQACGDTGPGRMLEPVEIVQRLGVSGTGCLQGRVVVVTAGPTFEDIDPVRFIGNRSSGKMGFAVAEAALAAGARVHLVAGPVNLRTPAGVERTDVRGAVEMRDVALALAAGADLFISVAAVADYTPAKPERQKIKKGPPRQTLDLESTPDIVAEVAAMEEGPLTVGFAAETENLRQHARDKLSRKRLDMIAANRVGLDGSGFESEMNEIVILTPEGETDLGKGNKRDLARLLVEEAARRLKGKDDIESCTAQNTRPATRN
jgi:phosphopantothenoylcysteine decarboxylase/phosphopantothenate--cysteine ligase